MDLPQEARLDGDAEDELTFKKKKNEKSKTDARETKSKGKSLVKNQKSPSGRPMVYS